MDHSFEPRDVRPATPSTHPSRRYDRDYLKVSKRGCNAVKLCKPEQRRKAMANVTQTVNVLTLLSQQNSISGTTPAASRTTSLAPGAGTPRQTSRPRELSRLGSVGRVINLTKICHLPLGISAESIANTPRQAGLDRTSKFRVSSRALSNDSLRGQGHTFNMPRRNSLLSVESASTLQQPTVEEGDEDPSPVAYKGGEPAAQEGGEAPVKPSPRALVGFLARGDVAQDHGILLEPRPCSVCAREREHAQAQIAREVDRKSGRTVLPAMAEYHSGALSARNIPEPAPIVLPGTRLPPMLGGSGAVTERGRVSGPLETDPRSWRGGNSSRGSSRAAALSASLQAGGSGRGLWRQGAGEGAGTPGSATSGGIFRTLSGVSLGSEPGSAKLGGGQSAADALPLPPPPRSSRRVSQPRESQPPGTRRVSRASFASRPRGSTEHAPSRPGESKDSVGMRPSRPGASKDTVDALVRRLSRPRGSTEHAPSRPGESKDSVGMRPSRPGASKDTVDALVRRLSRPRGSIELAPARRRGSVASSVARPSGSTGAAPTRPQGSKSSSHGGAMLEDSQSAAAAAAGCPVDAGEGEVGGAAGVKGAEGPARPPSSLKDGHEDPSKPHAHVMFAGDVITQAIPEDWDGEGAGPGEGEGAVEGGLEAAEAESGAEEAGGARGDAPLSGVITAIVAARRWEAPIWARERGELHKQGVKLVEHNGKTAMLKREADGDGGRAQRDEMRMTRVATTFQRGQNTGLSPHGESPHDHQPPRHENPLLLKLFEEAAGLNAPREKEPEPTPSPQGTPHFYCRRHIHLDAVASRKIEEDREKELVVGIKAVRKIRGHTPEEKSRARREQKIRNKIRELERDGSIGGNESELVKEMLRLGGGAVPEAAGMLEANLRQFTEMAVFRSALKATQEGQGIPTRPHSPRAGASPVRGPGERYDAARKELESPGRALGQRGSRPMGASAHASHVMRANRADYLSLADKTHAPARKPDGVNWSLDTSPFTDRKKLSDSRGYYDGRAVRVQRFACDWMRVKSRPGFVAMVSKASGAWDWDGMEGLRKAVEARCDTLSAAFAHYAAMGPPGEQCYSLPLHRLSHMLEDAGVELSEDEIQHIYQQVVKDRCRGDAYPLVGMVRLELIYAMCLVATSEPAARGVDEWPQSLGGQVEVLLDRCIAPCLPPEAVVDAQDFRKHRLYKQAVGALVEEHASDLEAVFKGWSARDLGDGRDMSMDTWLFRLRECGLVGAVSGVTTNEAKACFLQSQMVVVDDVKARSRRAPDRISYLDFLEALGRLADVAALPPAWALLRSYEANEGDSWDIRLDAVKLGPWPYWEKEVPRVVTAPHPDSSGVKGAPEPPPMPPVEEAPLKYLREMHIDGAENWRRPSQGIFAPNTRPLDEKLVTVFQVVIADHKARVKGTAPPLAQALKAGSHSINWEVVRGLPVYEIEQVVRPPRASFGAEVTGLSGARGLTGLPEDLDEPARPPRSFGAGQ